MSRGRTTDEGREARVVARLFETLELGGEPPVLDDPVDRALLRAHVEVLGLLAHVGEPQAPSPRLEEEILRRIAAPLGPGADPLPFVAPAARQRAQRGAPRWLTTLAAALAIAVLGLSFALVRVAGRQERTLAELGARLEQAAGRLDDLSTVEARIASVQERLELVTGPAVEVCSLRPTGESPMPADARGVLYIADDHQSWYLTLDGLPAAPDGRVYHLWFQAAGRPVSAGMLEPRDGRAERMAHSMPEGVQAVFVTVETAEAPTEPTGPRVLFGDEAMTIL